METRENSREQQLKLKPGLQEAPWWEAEGTPHLALVS